MEVTCESEARQLNDWLLTYGAPVGLDTETTGWKPADKVSPVGRAKVWCVTLAWGEPGRRTPSGFHTCFVPREYVPALTPWLESRTPQKVGTNLLGFDRHAFANSGIRLNGILADTDSMSRLLDPARWDTYGKHSLKAWGARLGYEITQFDEFAGGVVTVAGKLEEYKKVSTRTAEGVRRTTGGWRQEVRFKKVSLDLDTVWERYPERQALIRKYAEQDPAMSLDTYYFLRGQLEAVKF